MVVAAADIGISALRTKAAAPDYQIGYVASAPLSEETAAALEDAFASLGEDCSGDGRVYAQLHAYVDMADVPDADQVNYAYAAKVTLMADLEACDSSIFILDAPETFHVNYQVLAREDGSLADSPEEICAVPLAACPGLTGLTGSDAAPPEGLYLARRGYWQDRTCAYRDQCDALWAALTEGINP